MAAAAVGAADGRGGTGRAPPPEPPAHRGAHHHHTLTFPAPPHHKGYVLLCSWPCMTVDAHLHPGHGMQTATRRRCASGGGAASRCCTRWGAWRRCGGCGGTRGARCRPCAAAPSACASPPSRVRHSSHDGKQAPCYFGRRSSLIHSVIMGGAMVWALL